jgi:FlaA1/EpsC-like NDP-sugar epimerase
MALDPTHPDYWTQALQFTEIVHRDVYPAIEPTNGKMRQIANGKVVIVTGAGTGFGQVGSSPEWTYP